MYIDDYNERGINQTISFILIYSLYNSYNLQIYIIWSSQRDV